jgi:hypothetical protein
MKASVTILEVNMEVEYDFNITTHGSQESWSSYGGDPAEPAEFDIKILGLEFPKQHADVRLEIPEWLKDMLTTHLLERDDINAIVQQADQESDYDE